MSRRLTSGLRQTLARREVCGFTLVEVLAAAAVLAMSAAAVTGIVSLALRAGGEQRHSEEDRQAALAFLWDLDLLPFTRHVAPAMAGVGPTTAAVLGQGVVQRVFPHADTARNTAQAFYTGAGAHGWSSGAFVNVDRAHGRDLVVVARFVAREGSSWVHLDHESVVGLYEGVGALPAVAVTVELHAFKGSSAEGVPVAQSVGPVLACSFYTAELDQTEEPDQ